jgi:hypothetical protein
LYVPKAGCEQWAASSTTTSSITEAHFGSHKRNTKSEKVLGHPTAKHNTIAIVD